MTHSRAFQAHRRTEAPCGTTRPTSHQAKHPKTSDPAENRAKEKKEKGRGERIKVPNKGRALAKLPPFSPLCRRGERSRCSREFQWLAGPHAPRGPSVLLQRSSAPALPCPSLPALVGRTVGCRAASPRRQWRFGEKNGDRGFQLAPSPKMLLGLALQQTSMTCLSKRGLCQPTDSGRD